MTNNLKFAKTQDHLIVRGSGSSTNKFYKITVDGGTITATEVSL